MPRLLASLALVATLCLGAHTARADEPDDDGYETWVGPMLAITLLGPLDLGLAIHDVSVKDSSRTYGKVETLIMAPQVIGSAFAVADAFSNGSTDDQVVTSILLAGTSALFAHGLHEWIEDDSPQEEPRVAPMLVGGGTSPGLGFGLSGAW